MTKHLYLIIVATFIFGFITGVVIFFMSATGDGGGAIREETHGFIVTARAYGGCERMGAGTCPSYRINDAGEYTYIVPEFGGTITQFRGKLSAVEMRAFTEALESTTPRAFEQSVFEGTCPIAYDGLGYQYDFTYDSGAHVELDSCVHKLDSTLFAVLEAYFVTLYEKHIQE